jgi:RNA polymerase sigma-70 factor (ECF subfamily)
MGEGTRRFGADRVPRPPDRAARRPGAPFASDVAAAAGTDAGRRRRYEQLMVDNYAALLGYAARRVDQPADAADVVCDVFVVAWRRIDEVPAGHEGTLWLYGVARRTLANTHRSMKRRRALDVRLRAQVEAAQIEPPDALVTEPVNEALARLSADDRELITLTAWEGLSPTEIATVLGVEPGTVRVRLHRARRRLTKFLDEDIGTRRKVGSAPLTGRATAGLIAEATP